VIDESAHDVEQLTAPTAVPDVLAAMYHAFQDTLIVDQAPADNALKSLVTFDDARTEPIHRWYGFKEGYSHRLLGWLLSQGIMPNDGHVRILDPYCGVGTTLLASMAPPCGNRIDTVAGVERNPAILSIARAKISWTQYKIERIEELLKRLRDDRGRCGRYYAVPALSTFTETRSSGKRAFAPASLQDLLYYRAWIDAACAHTIEHRFFMLAWLAIIEKASNTRKDGRALRLVPETGTVDVKALLLAQCATMLADLVAMRDAGLGGRDYSIPSAYAIGGDARDLPFVDGAFTMLCYSPPYLNNIDYTEVYKLELWLRGDVTTQDEFRSLRLSTFRSHPSVFFPPTSLCDELDGNEWIVRLKSALLSALPADPYRHMRRWLFAGYIDDLILSLREQYRVAAPGAPIVCVVGNSLHGGQQRVPVCTDLLIAATAQAVGLIVDRLRIARQLPRRDHQNGWLRETIIVMHKPVNRRI